MDKMSYPATIASPSTSSAMSTPIQMPSGSGSPQSSPDSSPIENIISGILAVAINSEDVIWCRTCDETMAMSKCLDCGEFFCDSCVKVHILSMQNHRTTRLFNNNSGSQPLYSLGTPSPPTALCESHCEPYRQFCETCVTPACVDCIIADHSDHKVISIEEASGTAKTVNMSLCSETLNAIHVVREAIERICKMSDSVDKRSLGTAFEVKTFTRQCLAALQRRELELIKHIDHTRQMKGKLLTNQLDNLRSIYAKLGRTSDILKQAVYCATPQEVLAINAKAEKELRQIRALEPVLLPCEDDDIMFLPPDKTFLQTVSSIGNIIINFSQLSSMMNKTPSSSEPHPSQIKGGGFYPSQRNRAIYGANPVKVKNAFKMPLITFGKGKDHEEKKDGNLCRPWGVCCDHMGNIIVADRSNHRIQIFNAEGTFLYNFGKEGTEPGLFQRPAGITISPQGHIVVADKDNHRIQVFKVDGTFVRTFGEQGTRNGQFQYPWDVACNSQGVIVVTDSRNHRIQLFAHDGTFLHKFEGYSGKKDIESPRGVCFHPKGDIIVTDFNKHRLVIIDPYLLKAEYIGYEGSSFDQFLRPQGVVCDDEGNIVVADSKNNRVQVLTMTGKFLYRFGAPGRDLGQLDKPCGICLNPEGRIVIVDFGNNRVQIF